MASTSSMGQDTAIESQDPNQLRPPPTTISCKLCDRTVGDSSTWLSSSREMNSATFEHLTSVFLSDKIEIGEAGDWDEYSTYKAVHCEKCQTAIGKYYIGTPPKLTDLVGHYTLSAESLTVHHFGSRSGSLSVAKDREIAQLLHPMPDMLVIELTKVKAFCVLLNDRLVALQQENLTLNERLLKLENERAMGKTNNQAEATKGSGNDEVAKAGSDGEETNESSTLTGTNNGSTTALNPVEDSALKEQQQHLRYDGKPDEKSPPDMPPPALVQPQQITPTEDESSVPEEEKPKPQPKTKSKTHLRGRSSRASARISNVSSIKDSEDEGNHSVDEFRFSASADEEHRPNDVKTPKGVTKLKGKPGRPPKNKRTPSVEIIQPEEFVSSSSRKNPSTETAVSATPKENEERKKRPRTMK